MPQFNIIFATDEKYGFSKDGKLPWNIPEDLQYFKQITASTLDAAVLMGRKTFESIGRPLPNRKNYVMSKTLPEDTKGITVLKDLSEFWKIGDSEKVWVIGGIELISYFMAEPSLVTNISITTIKGDYDCDQKFDYRSLVRTADDYINIGISQRAKAWFALSHTGCQRISADYQYLQVLRDILGQPLRKTRNGEVRSMFGATLRFNDISKQFPILYSKRVFWKGIVEELLFFLAGLTDTKLLEARGVNIWKGNTSREFLESHNKVYQHDGLPYGEGEMGPMYGYQLRHFGRQYFGRQDDTSTGSGVDQLENVINLLVKDPMSRRILMTTYNPAQAEEGVLYPCHGLTIQFYVDSVSSPSGMLEQPRISLSMYQRSADWFLGVPFNITSYAMLLYIVVQEVNETLELLNSNATSMPMKYIPGDLVLNFGDVHLYSQHLPQALEQLQRSTKETHTGAKFIIPPVIGLLAKSGEELWASFSSKDFYVTDYNPLPSIKAEMIA